MRPNSPFSFLLAVLLVIILVASVFEPVRYLKYVLPIVLVSFISFGQGSLLLTDTVLTISGFLLFSILGGFSERVC